MRWPLPVAAGIVRSVLLLLVAERCRAAQDAPSPLPLHEEHLPILDRVPDKHEGIEFNATLDEYPVDSAVVPCDFLPVHFIWCERPVDLTDKPPTSSSDSAPKQQEGQGQASSAQGSRGARTAQPIGCKRWGGRRYQDVARTQVRCHALRGIECRGNRTFLRGDVPCLRYQGHHFLTTLLYSLLLGFLGIDRFCLGHTGSAVGKLLTLGGIGVWWVVDIVLLIFGDLGPADDSSWMPYY